MSETPFTIAADFPLPPRIAHYGAATAPDVRIMAGPVAEKLAREESRGVAYSANERQMIIRLPGGLRYLIEDGERIVYDRGDASACEVELFLLSSVWGCLCYQRGLLPIHASAIIHGEDVHAFTGRSGAGKSTLATELGRHGHPFFTDDILIVDVRGDDAGPICYSSHTDLKLWKDALDLTEAERIGPVRDDPSFEKYFVKPALSGGRTSGRLASLTFLVNEDVRSDGRPAYIDRVSGGRSLKMLKHSLYRPAFAEAIWGRRRLFDALARTIAGVEVHRFDRSLKAVRYAQDLDVMKHWLSARPGVGARASAG